MVQINFAAREVNCKIVYCGPHGSGKKTSLQVIHAKLPDDNKGDLISLGTREDETLWLDFVPLDAAEIANMPTKFHLYTVPGLVYHGGTRKLLLQGADGVVFVADSRPEMKDVNIESLEDLADNLRENGLDIDTMPLVFQWNKRDLPDAMPTEQMNADLNRWNAPAFETVATRGEGVLPALKKLTGLIEKKLQEEYGAGPAGPPRPAQPSSSRPPRPMPRPAPAPSRPGRAADRSAKWEDILAGRLAPGGATDAGESDAERRARESGGKQHQPAARRRAAGGRRARPRDRLGEVLIGEGVLGEDQLLAALEEQRRTGEILGDVLVRMCYVTEEEIACAIAVISGLPYIDATDYRIDDEIVGVFPSHLLAQYQFVPLDRVGGVVTVAAGSPLTPEILAEIEATAGARVLVYVTKPSEVRSLLGSRFAADRPGHTEGPPPPGELNPLGDMLLGPADD